MTVPQTVTWGSLPAGAVAFNINQYVIKTDDTNATDLATGVVNSAFNPSTMVQSFPNASLKLD